MEKRSIQISIISILEFKVQTGGNFVTYNLDSKIAIENHDS
jgi:hypothetical protein